MTTSGDEGFNKSFWGHSGPVHTVAFSPDGRLLAAGGFGRTVRIYQRNGELYKALRGHRDWVNGVAFSPDGAMLASGSADWSVRLWDVDSGVELRRYADHQDWVRGVAFDPSGLLLASAGADGKIIVRDVTTDEEVFTWTLTSPESRIATRWVNTVAFHPDSRRSLLAAAGDDGVVRVWDVGTGSDEPLVRLDGGAAYIRTLAFNVDGSLIAAATVKNVVSVWSTQTWESVATCPNPTPEDTDVVRALTFHPDGRLALGGVAGTVRMWDLAKPKPERRPFDVHRASYINALAIDPEGEVLAAACEDDKVQVYDIAERRGRSEGHGEIKLHDGGIRGLAFSRDGTRLASGGSNRCVRLWQVPDGSLDKDRDGHNAWVNSVAFHPLHDNLLASASGDRTARLWDLDEPPDAPARRVFGPHDGFVRSVAFDPAGALLATGSSDTEIRLFDVATADLRRRLPGHRSQVNQVAFSPDGALLASASHDETARLWKVSDGSQLHLLRHGERVNAIAFSPDGTMVATGSGDNLVTLWDTATGRRRAELAGHTAFVRALAFHPTESDILASAGADRVIRLWSLKNRRTLRLLTGHQGWVRTLAFTRDRSWVEDGHTMLASGGADGKILLWDPRTGKAVGGTRELGPAPDGDRQPRFGGLGLASDEPSGEDHIGIRRDVDILAHLITATDTAPPLAVALPGNWGIGKSSLLKQLATRIDALAKLSSQHPDEWEIVQRVRQIQFNVWHYNDGPVLVGIAAHLFKALDAELKGPDAEGRTLADWTTQRDAEVKDYQDSAAQVADLEAALALFDASRTGWLAHNARMWALPLASLALGAGVFTVQKAFGAAASVVAVVTGFAAWLQDSEKRRKEEEKLLAALQKIKNGAHTVLHPKASLRREAEKRLTKAKAERDERRERLEQAGPVDWLGAVRAEASPDPELAAAGGLAHRIRERLEAICALLGNRDEAGVPMLGRIVVYIDDLDRCRPEQVVAVLAALRQLLAFPLFVAVVPIDPRWILKCLAQHHQHIDGDGESVEAASWDYLDKIFQIPFALPPFDAAAAETFVSHLVQDSLIGPDPFDPGPGDDGAGLSAALSTPRPTDGDAPVDEDLMARALKLSPNEAFTLTKVSSLMETPRLAKRLVNIYRLARMGIDNLDDYLAADVDHLVVQLMLAIRIGAPARAERLLAALIGTEAFGHAFDQALRRSGLIRGDRPAPAAWPKLRERLEEADPEHIRAAVRHWHPMLRRFSFHSWIDTAEDELGTQGPDSPGAVGVNGAGDPVGPKGWREAFRRRG